MNKNSKFISEILLNEKKGNIVKNKEIYGNGNKINTQDFIDVKLNKYLYLLPSNNQTNKKLMAYKLKNYKENKNRSDFNKEKINLIYFLTDNSLISIYIPNFN